MIGLEIHCQLTNLKSKLFCSCKSDYRKFELNSNICPVCVGLPGTLPCLNQDAVKKAITIAMALNCTIPKRLAFFRKNYFYPDLPKNFQITQLDIYGQASIGATGHVIVGDDKIRIRRVQLEEDPGRLIYEGSSEKTKITLVDYNRAGTSLVEIVTEPDFANPQQVRLFLNILSDLLDNLGVSDPTLEGAIRADGNISVKGGPKVEVKNINSFHDLQKAIHFEIARQESMASRGVPIMAETRQWDVGRKTTIPARKKEDDLDYRYFLEGDIPWIIIDSQTLDKLKKDMPESILSKRQRYVSLYGISSQVADVLSSNKFYSDLFEQAHTESNAKEIANMITTDLMGLVDTREKQDSSKLSAQHLRDLSDLIQANTITKASAKTALHEIVKTGRALDDIIRDHDLGNVSDESILSGIVDQVVSEQKDAVENAKTNSQFIHYLVGKVMKKTGGKANPQITLDLLKKKIDIS